MTRPDLDADELLDALPLVLRQRQCREHERAFVVDMLARAQRPGWRPSPGQCAYMAQLVEAAP